MNYIITKNQEFFKKIGDYNYCSLEDMILPETIALDTETTGFDPFKDSLFSIQIGTGTNNYIIDLQSHESNCIVLSEVIPFIDNKIIIFHNAAFDLSFFFIKNYFLKNVRDTMLASMIYYNGDPTIRHSFKECMNRELNIYYDKTEQGNIATVQLSQPSTIEYCFNDVDKLIELHNKYLEKLTDYNALETYVLHCSHIRALTYIQLCGLPLSKDAWQNKMNIDYKKYKEAEYEVKEYIFDNLPRYRDLQLELFSSEKKINCLLSSSQQMIPIFKSLGINVEVEEKGVIKESIEKTVLSKSKHEFVKLWLNFKENEHNVTTFGSGIFNKIQSDNRIYTRFNPILDTARISSRKGEINFLNFPATKETRECFIANDGYKIIVADYAGQETIVGADITGDFAMIESIVDKKDLHCAFARVLYPEIKDLTDAEIIKEHKAKRNASKGPRFCFQFGGTGYTLALNEGLPIEEGMRIESLFKQLHSGIYDYGNTKLKEAISKGYIEYALGFKLRLPNYKYFISAHADILKFDNNFWETYRIGKAEYKNKKEADKAFECYEIKNYAAYELFLSNKHKISDYFTLKSQYFRLCLNAPTQGTAAHQTKYATVLLFNEIEKNNDYWNVRIANVIHDEIVLEVKDSLCDKYKVILEQSMINGGNLFLNNPVLFMSAEANAAESWSAAK